MFYFFFNLSANFPEKITHNNILFTGLSNVPGAQSASHTVSNEKLF